MVTLSVCTERVHCAHCPLSHHHHHRHVIGKGICMCIPNNSIPGLVLSRIKEKGGRANTHTHTHTHARGKAAKNTSTHTHSTLQEKEATREGRQRRRLSV